MPPRRGRDDSDSDGEYLPKMSGRRRPKSVVNEADDEDRAPMTMRFRAAAAASPAAASPAAADPAAADPAVESPAAASPAAASPAAGPVTSPAAAEGLPVVAPSTPPGKILLPKATGPADKAPFLTGTTTAAANTKPAANAPVIKKPRRKGKPAKSKMAPKPGPTKGSLAQNDPFLGIATLFPRPPTGGRPVVPGPLGLPQGAMGEPQPEENNTQASHSSNNNTITGATGLNARTTTAPTSNSTPANNTNIANPYEMDPNGFPEHVIPPSLLPPHIIIPDNIYKALEHRYSAVPPTDEMDRLYQMGIQYGIGLGIACYKSGLMQELSDNGSLFGRKLVLDRGRTAEGVKDLIETNDYFDRVIAGQSFLLYEYWTQRINEQMSLENAGNAQGAAQNGAAFGMAATSLNPMLGQPTNQPNRGYSMDGPPAFDFNASTLNDRPMTGGLQAPRGPSTVFTNDFSTPSAASIPSYAGSDMYRNNNPINPTGSNAISFNVGSYTMGQQAAMNASNDMRNNGGMGTFTHDQWADVLGNFDYTPEEIQQKADELVVGPPAWRVNQPARQGGGAGQQRAGYQVGGTGNSNGARSSNGTRSSIGTGNFNVAGNGNVSGNSNDTGSAGANSPAGEGHDNSSTPMLAETRQGRAVIKTIPRDR
ncbi:hypothetical protein UCREL1_2637 [Eutypa lata UCREL1]|uniref:Uncharacterized protein n=1 Tax=Eutypa lata (strain UCR-EL1) TaxID=1287681 RepID=M7SUT5_EUTLA|nr:hypothetical protein UCREL1_2637 [Eutypa lata UCREL1]